MAIKSAVLTFKNGKSYIPVLGRTDSGLYFETEPVFICDIDLDEIKTIIDKLQIIGHPYIQILKKEDRMKEEKKLLYIYGERSWKELAKKGFSYTLSWGNQLVITFSRLDKQGRWEYDPEKTRLFPIETPLEEIIQVIIDDYHSRGQ